MSISRWHFVLSCNWITISVRPTKLTQHLFTGSKPSTDRGDVSPQILEKGVERGRKGNEGRERELWKNCPLRFWTVFMPLLVNAVNSKQYT